MSAPITTRKKYDDGVETVDVDIRVWDPSTMLRDRRALVLGKPGTGKTILGLDLMYHLRDMDGGIILCPTDKFSGQWESIAPPAFIFHQYSPIAIDNVVKEQERLFMEEYTRLVTENRAKGIPTPRESVKIPPVWIIADDCMYENQLKSDGNIKKIFQNGRHLKIFLMIMCQYLLDMPIALRQLTDYVFVCREDSPPTLERLYKYFFNTYVPTYAAFLELVEQITEDNGILVLDRTNTKSSLFIDHVFCYKATVRPPFSYRIGPPEMWEFNNDHYEDEFILNNKTKTKQMDKYYFVKPSNQPKLKINRIG